MNLSWKKAQKNNSCTMRYIVFFIASLLCKYSFAQHCPFDGAHLIAVKAVGKNGKMMTGSNPVFYLKEVDNSMSDSCTSSPGLIKKQLLTDVQFKADCNERYGRNRYNSTLKDRLTKAGVFANANRMININQGECTCMLTGKSETVYTNYIYRPRKFVIAYSINGKEINVPVPAELIFSLCTSSNLQNFEPVTIQL
jgi:hypothetical protein